MHLYFSLSSHYLLASMVSGKTSAVNPTLIRCLVCDESFLATSKILGLYLSAVLIMMPLGVDLSY